jgi:hypothetical protein
MDSFVLALVWGMAACTPGVQVSNSEIQCIKHDTSAISVSGQQTMEKCADNTDSEDFKTNDDDVVDHFCFSVWQTKYNSIHSIGLTVKGAGCIASSRQAKTHYSCKQEQCVANIRKDQWDQQIIYCCCNTTFCNHQFTYNPGKEMSTTTDPLDTQLASEDNAIIYMLGCVGVVSIICIVVLIGCLMVQRDRLEENSKNKIVLPFSEGHHLIVCPKENNKKDQDKLNTF